MSTANPVNHFGRALDFTGFAQEFMRRNPAYKQQYAALAEQAEFDPLAQDSREMARSWGLTFPDLPA